VKRKRIAGSKKPKNSLRLPDLDQAKASVLIRDAVSDRIGIEPLQ